MNALNPNDNFKLKPPNALSISINKQNEEVISVEFVNKNPLDNKLVEDEYLYKVTKYKNGSSNIEKVPKELNNQNNSTKTFGEVTLDLNADSLNKAPIILRPDFNLKARITNVGNKLDSQWKEHLVYLSLSQQEQNKIEKNNDMKKMYRDISFDNVSNIHQAIQAGILTPEMLNANNGMALRMVIANGSLEMAQTLFNGGASPHAIDPKSCYTKEMAELVIQEQYKQNNPIMSTIRDSFGIGMPKPKYM